MLSQAYLFGHVDNPDHRVEVVDGDFLDLRDDTLCRIDLQGRQQGWRSGCQWQLERRQASSGTSKSRKDDDPEPVDRDKIEAALNVISSDCSVRNLAESCRRASLRARRSRLRTVRSVVGESTPVKYTPEESRERWRGARTMTDITVATLFRYADEADHGWRDRYLLDRMNNAFRASADADPAGSDAAGADAGNEQAADDELGCQRRR